jgi:hypothetical protein
MTTLIFVVISFFILAALVLIKRKYSDITIDNSFVIISIIPIVVWMLDSGKLSELSYGDFTIKLKSATSKPILVENQSNVISKVASFEEASKMDLSFSSPKNSALTFTLGNKKISLIY